MSWTSSTSLRDICNTFNINALALLARYNPQRYYSNQIDFSKILSNGRHNCPGCGATFRICNSSVDTPGWIDIKRIAARLRWMANVPSGTPQIFVTWASDVEPHIPNKFERQSNWFNRNYTKLEYSRIQHRMSLKPGDATELLRRRLGEASQSSGPGSHNQASSTSNATPLIEDLANEDMIIDREKFENLATSLDAIDKKDLSQDRKTTSRPLICQRCHNLSSNECITHDVDYANAIVREPQLILKERDRMIINEEMNSRSIIVLLTDLVDLPDSIPSNALELLGRYLRPGEEFPSVVLVGNKIDLMPKNMRNIKGYLIDLAKQRLGQLLEGKILGAHLVSAKEGTGLIDLCRVLLGLATERDGNVFLLGKTNVGKSQLFNRLVRDRLKAVATVSSQAGTTIGVIKSRLSWIRWTKDMPGVPVNKWLIDLPGIVDDKLALKTLLSPREAKQISVSHRIRATRRMLRPGETGLFGGLIRICCEGDDSSIQVRLKVYMRPDWHYFRVPNHKVDAFVTSSLGSHRPQPPHLVPPFLSNGPDDLRWSLFANPEIACETIVSGTDAVEIAFEGGVGWLSAHLAEPSHQVKLKIFTPSGVGAAIRKLSLNSYVID